MGEVDQALKNLSNITIEEVTVVAIYDSLIQVCILGNGREQLRQQTFHKIDINICVIVVVAYGEANVCIYRVTVARS